MYNDGNALIHDTRTVTLVSGVNHIAWRDVSANMDPASAVLDSLLRKYVGEEVIVVHPARFAGERERREPARILSIENGIVLQYRDRIKTSLHLEGLVSLTNGSGTSYKNARLQLVAGNVNVASLPGLKTIAKVSASSSADTYGVNARQENYFEYHLYTLADRRLRVVRE